MSCRISGQIIIQPRFGTKIQSVERPVRDCIRSKRGLGSPQAETHNHQLYTGNRHSVDVRVHEAQKSTPRHRHILPI